MKRKISILLVLAMMISLLGANAYASEAEETATTVIDITYADVPADAWYAEAVYAMTRGGLVTGYSFDGFFHPDDPITVGQLAAILCRVGGIDSTNSTFVPMKRGNVEYTEPSHWAFMALLNTRENLVYDVDPKWADDQVLRGEAIDVMYKLALKLPEYYTDIPVGDTTIKRLLCDLPENQIWNTKNIPDLYMWDRVRSDMVVNDKRYIDVQMDTIVKAYNLGLTHGVDANGTGNFGSTVTRAQLCQMLYNMGISEAGSVPFEQYQIKNTQGVQIL